MSEGFVYNAPLYLGAVAWLIAIHWPEIKNKFGSGGATRGSQPAKRGHCYLAQSGAHTVGRQSGPLPIPPGKSA